MRVNMWRTYVMYLKLRSTVELLHRAFALQSGGRWYELRQDLSSLAVVNFGKYIHITKWTSYGLLIWANLFTLQNGLVTGMADFNPVSHFTNTCTHINIFFPAYYTERIFEISVIKKVGVTSKCFCFDVQKRRYVTTKAVCLGHILEVIFLFVFESTNMSLFKCKL